MGKLGRFKKNILYIIQLYDLKIEKCSTNIENVYNK